MKRFALLLAAALLTAALAACTPAGPASSVPGASSAPSQSASSAPQSTPAPEASSTASSAVSSAMSSVPADPQAAMSRALEACVSFGPGEAGSSLKAAIAACALLDSAQELAAPEEDWGACFDAWYQQQDAEKQEMFWENWPGLAADVRSIGQDPAAQAGLLESAGSPNRHDHYDAQTYEPMLRAVESRQP